MPPNFKLNRVALAIALASTAATSAYAQSLDISNDANQEVVELDNIFVTASGVGVNVNDAPASVSVITNQELLDRPASTIADALGRLPGVSGGYTSVGAGSKIKFRGLPDKYTLVLIDGKRIGNSSLLGHRPDTLTQDLGGLSPEDIERIEVVRGAMSTLYGSDAMGGVVNIITKKVSPIWTGSVSSTLEIPDSGSKGDTYSNSFSVSGPIVDGLGIRLGGSHTKREADSSPDGNSGTKNQAFNGKLTWEANQNHSFYLEGKYGEQKSDNLANNLAEGEELISEEFALGTMKNYNFGVGYDGRFGDVNTKLDLYMNRYKNENDDTASAWSGAESKEYVADFKVDMPLTTFGIDQFLTAGLQYKKEEVSNPSNIGNIATFILEAGGTPVPVEPNPDGWAWSIFLEDQIFLRDNLTLTLGIRGDKSDGYDFHVSPRAYMVYHPTDSWTVRGGVSKGYRAPNLKERSLTSGTSSMGMGCNSLTALGYSGGGCVMVGNPDLEPEESVNYELGLGYEHPQGYAAGITWFKSDIDNMMQNGVLGRFNGVWYTQQYNIEKGATEGIEATFKLPIIDSLTLSGNATYMIESKNKTTGDRLTMIPEWTANATLDWQATEKLSTFLAVQYIGKQLYEPLAQNATNNFVESNTTLDVGMNFNVNKNVTLRAGVKNLTNNVAKTDDDYGDGNGRSYYAGLTARF
ncbi:MAG: TonB-dependent receptor [Alcaligenaceae bacterium]|jgi:outer membrane receptor for ferrienterochelin and colicins|nr:TonB-dependent receptor [Alcaligenaceae bacterium]